jgi:hypothetical protein
MFVFQSEADKQTVLLSRTLKMKILSKRYLLSVEVNEPCKRARIRFRKQVLRCKISEDEHSAESAVETGMYSVVSLSDVLPKLNTTVLCNPQPPYLTLPLIHEEVHYMMKPPKESLPNITHKRPRVPVC